MDLKDEIDGLDGKLLKKNRLFKKNDTKNGLRM
jgi:hypothetical protein